MGQHLRASHSLLSEQIHSQVSSCYSVILFPTGFILRIPDPLLPRWMNNMHPSPPSALGLPSVHVSPPRAFLETQPSRPTMQTPGSHFELHLHPQISIQNEVCCSTCSSLSLALLLPTFLPPVPGRSRQPPTQATHTHPFPLQPTVFAQPTGCFQSIAVHVPPAHDTCLEKP